MCQGDKGDEKGCKKRIGPITHPLCISHPLYLFSQRNHFQGSTISITRTSIHTDRAAYKGMLFFVRGMQ